MRLTPSVQVMMSRTCGSGLENGAGRGKLDEEEEMEFARAHICERRSRNVGYKGLLEPDIQKKTMPPLTKGEVVLSAEKSSFVNCLTIVNCWAWIFSCSEL